ncbi:MAG: hypothetical protein U0835_06245 [Isosphaeraceae bacterium]
MTAPLVLEVPDDSGELATWLDRQVVGLHLGRLVAELEAVHAGRPAGPAPTLDEVLAEHGSEVLGSGLNALPRVAVRVLLRHPRLLTELQERVLLEGGPHWSALQGADEGMSGALAADWSQIQTGMLPAGRRGRSAAAAAAPSQDRPSRPAPPPRPPAVRLLRAWAKLATIAASMLGFFVAILAREIPSPAAATAANFPAQPFSPGNDWGWNRPGIFGGASSRGVYLTLLADSAEQWFDERPSSAVEFARRLGELRTGCSRLLVASHDALPEADRTWLTGQCREWTSAIDQAIKALEHGEAVDRVREGVDATVRRIVESLRERGKAA